MSDYIELGPVPCNEECSQVGSETFERNAVREMTAYRHQLERLFPEACFTVKWFPHDFGRYGEVVVKYIVGTESEEIAYHVESHLPQHWDDLALKELAGVSPESVRIV